MTEERLRKLITGNGEQNRVEIALRWKEQGKKVIGLLCPYVPEEVIYAAGMLPWRITGSWRPNTPLAELYRTDNTCLYASHVLESLLSDELSFLDGVVSTNYDDDRRRLWDVWAHLGKTPFAHILHLPRVDSSLSYEMYSKSIRELMEHLGAFAGTEISADSLREAIIVQNTTRTLLREVYELRKRDIPPLSGAEMLGLTTAATIMPKDEFNKELGELLDFIKQRKASISYLRPRVLVASDALDNPAFIDLVENAGSLVAMDDLDTGSRYFSKEVDTDELDPVQALAKRYITRPPCPRMVFWQNQGMDQVIRWVQEYRVDAVLNLVQIYSYPRWYGVPHFANRLNAAGVPNMTVLRNYHFSNDGQLLTRVQAFLEMVAEGAPQELFAPGRT